MVDDMDFSNMKAGTYLVQGDNVKGLSLLDASGWGIGDGSNSGDGVRNLAQTVGYVYAALRERQDQIVQTPFTWTRNGREVDEPPFGFNAYEFARIDKGLSIYNNVYYHKSRGRGSRTNTITSLAWLDPGSVCPDQTMKVNLHTGYERYIRTVVNSMTGADSETFMDAEDLLKFEMQDMSELYSTASAVRAIRGGAAVVKGYWLNGSRVR